MSVVCLECINIGIRKVNGTWTFELCEKHYIFYRLIIEHVLRVRKIPKDIIQHCIMPYILRGLEVYTPFYNKDITGYFFKGTYKNK